MSSRVFGYNLSEYIVGLELELGFVEIICILDCLESVSGF